MATLALSPDPKPAFGDAKLRLAHFAGRGTVSGFDPEDVLQGALADCHLASALGSMAQFMDADLRRAFKDNGDGTFTVTFRQGGKTYPYRISTMLYRGEDGAARYMKAKHGNVAELWPALFEKALALHESSGQARVPSYRALAAGGFASEVMALLTGKRAHYRQITGATMLWNEITRSVDNGRAAALGTYADGRKYRGSGLIDDHSYSLLGYEVDEDGERWVRLRNPWGDTEPKHNGADDGEFWLTLDQAAKYFESYETVV